MCNYLHLYKLENLFQARNIFLIYLYQEKYTVDLKIERKRMKVLIILTMINKLNPHHYIKLMLCVTNPSTNLRKMGRKIKWRRAKSNKKKK